ncbi:MAG: YbaB/EbfC family nucleoid-associated protein [Phycisphaerae bacterium]|nr:YbaB/EbfC family nucleoid-associated protein [Phycisphaerae bacterium]MDW8262974.1 YbaB/EbfC family nucleoid-associated protein [Phycisphaerales bacterium]
MFDQFRNLANLPGLLSKAREMQERIQAMQEEIARREVSADAGGGLVTATVNGKLELLRLRIDRQRVDLNDVEMLEDLIAAAVRAAQAKAADVMRAEMAKMAAELGLPTGLIPGM